MILLGYIITKNLEKLYGRVREIFWLVLGGKKNKYLVVIINVIMDMYDGVVSIVRIIGGKTMLFTIAITSHQRFILSRYL